jgi:hypothetical protein
VLRFKIGTRMRRYVRSWEQKRHRSPRISIRIR